MNRYTLIAPVGVTPQVVTEAVYERHRNGGHLPDAVHILCTTTGEASVRAQLLGETGHRNFKGVEMQPDAAWERLCREVLGITPPPVIVHVAVRGHARLEDIRHPADDRAFADACYGLVARLSKAGQPMLVGCISGGRKSMSAHLMNAFSALARPGDVLCHVLVNPSAIESNPDFFYPTDPASEKVDLVDLEYPRLRPFLVKSLLEGREPSGLAQLLDAVRPHLLAEQKPAAAELVVGQGRSTLRLSDEQGKTLVELALSPARATTLLVFANALCAQPDGVVATEFTAESPRKEVAARHEVHQARAWITAYLGGPDPAPWTSTNDVSKTLGELKKALRTRPLAERFYDVAPAHDGVYRWPEAQPCPLHVRFAPALAGSRTEIEAGMARHFPNLSYGWV